MFEKKILGCIAERYWFNFYAIFYLFSNFSNIYTQHTNKVWGFKVEETEKMRFLCYFKR